MCIASRVTASIERPPVFPGADARAGAACGETTSCSSRFLQAAGHRRDRRRTADAHRPDWQTKPFARPRPIGWKAARALGIRPLSEFMTTPIPPPSSISSMLSAVPRRCSPLFASVCRSSAGGPARLSELSVDLAANADALERLLDANVGCISSRKLPDGRYANTMRPARICAGPVQSP